MARLELPITFDADDFTQAAQLQDLIAHLAPFVVDNVQVLDVQELTCGPQP